MRALSSPMRAPSYPIPCAIRWENTHYEGAIIHYEGALIVDDGALTLDDMRGASSPYDGRLTPL